jgi:hypothetical protein
MKRRPRRVSLKVSEVSMLAFYETVRHGLIPVKVTKIDKDTSGSIRITAKVTALRNTYPYDHGDIIEAGATTMIPRGAVRKFRSSPFKKVLPYSWEGVTV